eukprot:364759-Chlamydomonas_euryale.AAC.6
MNPSPTLSAPLFIPAVLPLQRPLPKVVCANYQRRGSLGICARQGVPGPGNPVSQPLLQGNQRCRGRMGRSTRRVCTVDRHARDRTPCLVELACPVRRQSYGQSYRK